MPRLLPPAHATLRRMRPCIMSRLLPSGVSSYLCPASSQASRKPEGGGAHGREGGGHWGHVWGVLGGVTASHTQVHTRPTWISHIVTHSRT